MSILSQFINSAARQVGRNVANDAYYGKVTLSQKSRNLQLAIAGLLLFFIIGFFIWAYKIGSELPEIEKRKAGVEVGYVETPITKVGLDKPELYRGHTVYTGKRGGKYYYSKSGKKVYIK